MDFVIAGMLGQAGLWLMKWIRGCDVVVAFWESLAFSWVIKLELESHAPESLM